MLDPKVARWKLTKNLGPKKNFFFKLAKEETDKQYIMACEK